jgi:DNA-directed RNA polymerase specialized sigma24 family protein
MGNDEQLREAVRLYGEGWSLQRLAKRYSCDAETVRQRLRTVGVEMRQPWERTP